MKKQILFLVICSVTSQVVARTNILRSHDINFKSMHKKDCYKSLSVRSSVGLNQTARNAKGDKVSSPQYLSSEQNALAMIKGMPEGSQARAISDIINWHDDNGVRGHYIVDGDFNILSQVVVTGQYHFDHEWTIGLSLPFYHMRFDNIVWNNQTKNETADDRNTRRLLTNNFFSNVAKLGDGLNLQDWEQRGIGDTTLMTTWSRQFFQNREWIKQVNVTARAGVTFPTGIKKNEDKAFSLPFGNDGAYALPFGAGLDLRFKNLFWVGVNATFEHIFSHTKVRRIMTNEAQTHYLLLQKANTRKEYGFVQMFNLYIQPQISDAFSLRFAYAHTKTGDDKLFILSEDFSTMTANKSIELEDGTTHDLLIQFNWDAAKLKPNARFKPTGSVFAQIPFNGRSTLQSASLGFSVSMHF